MATQILADAIMGIIAEATASAITGILSSGLAATPTPAPKPATSRPTTRGSPAKVRPTTRGPLAKARPLRVQPAVVVAPPSKQRPRPLAGAPPLHLVVKPKQPGRNVYVQDVHNDEGKEEGAPKAVVVLTFLYLVV